MDTLQDRKHTLLARIAAADQPPVLFVPQMADIFRQKTADLAMSLQGDDEEQRASARQVLRGFIDKIVIPPGDGLLQVVGNLGEMLKAAADRTGSAAVGNVGCGGGI